MDEVEGIVVRLTGDGAHYKQMLKEAADATKRTEEAIISVGNHIDGFGDQLSRWGELAVSALALHALKQFLGESLNAWQETEDGMIKLTAVLEANKRDVELLTDRYSEFASGIQKVTKTSDDATIALLAQAESFGLTGSAAEKAVKDALGFAAMNDGNAASYLRLTAALAKGDVEMVKRFARMVPQLRGIKDETELMEKANLLAATGFKTVERQAATLTGQLTQLKNAWGDIMEEVGRVTSEALKPVVQIVRGIVDFLQEFSKEAKEAITSILLVTAALASVGPIVATAKATIIPLFTMIDDGFRLAARAVMFLINPMNLLRAAIAGVRLAMVAAKAVMMFALGPVGLAIAAIGIIAGVVIDQLGGFAETWNYIKATALAAWDTIKDSISDFWEWLKPIGRAALGVLAAAWEGIKGIVLAVWEGIKVAASTTWEFIKGIWISLVGDAEMSWEKIQLAIVTALIRAEFVIRNFGQMWDILTTNMAIAMQATMNTIRSTVQMSMGGLEMIIRESWMRIANVGKTGTLTMTDTLRTQIDTMRAEVQAHVESLAAPGKATLRQLQADRAKARAILRQSLADFTEMRLKQYFTVSEEDPKNKPISEAIRQDAQAAKKEMDNLQAVLRNSAESLSRIMKHQEMVRGGPRVNTNSSRAVPVQNNAAAAGTTEAVRRGNTFLERIEGHLANMRRQGGNNNVAPANLNP